VYARTVTVRGDPRAVDAGIAFVRDDVLPTIDRTDGCVGLSMLADRDSGHCIATTAWASEEAMYVGGPRLRAMRERLGALLGGRVEVLPWEIAVLHRLHEAPEGAGTRVTWARTVPPQGDGVVDDFRTDLLRRLQELPGYCSTSLLVGRREGRGASAVTFADRGDLDRTRDRAAVLREEFTRARGVEILAVAEFDLALAHLRVPQTV
jgi:hypothetical protein